MMLNMAIGCGKPQANPNFASMLHWGRVACHNLWTSRAWPVSYN